MDEITQSSNINAKWLENIYENIKRIEDHERLSREGCESLIDYVNIPPSKRAAVLGEAQFKNLRYMITEFSLLLSDLTPVIEDTKVKSFRKVLDDLEDTVNDEKLFIRRLSNAQRQLTSVELTKFFHITVRFLSTFKVSLFKEIKGILYIQTSTPW